MKFPGQTEDRVIDNLLRAYVSRPGNSHQECPDFDPDRANAYIERSLPDASRLQYEAHLSDCAACRKSVVTLARLADADAVATLSPAREVARSTWLTGAKQMFGALAQPRWAMAAAAVIVLVITLPLLLSRNNRAPETAQMVAENGRLQSAPEPVSPGFNTKSGEVAPAASNPAASKQRESSDEKTEVLARNAPAATTDRAAGVGATVELAKKSEAGSGSQLGEEAQRKSEGQVAQAAAQGAAVPGSQVAKNNSDQVRQQQPEKDSAQPVGEPKVAARADEVRAKEKTEDVAAPPAPASNSEVARGRAGLRRPGKLSLRDSGTGEAVRPEERKFSGKKFLLRDGAWTDKDFDPNKDLPIVTIIRDSNVYQEVLNKRPGLKPFLTGFAASERAIIVYKGTVYKLIPQ